MFTGKGNSTYGKAFFVHLFTDLYVFLQVEYLPVLLSAL